VLACGSYSVTAKEKHRYRVLENKVLRIIFGPERGSNWRMEKFTPLLKDYHLVEAHAVGGEAREL
jgi:hypothetical protein